MTYDSLQFHCKTVFIVETNGQLLLQHGCTTEKLHRNNLRHILHSPNVTAVFFCFSNLPPLGVFFWILRWSFPSCVGRKIENHFLSWIHYNIVKQLTIVLKWIILYTFCVIQVVKFSSSSSSAPTIVHQLHRAAYSLHRVHRHHLIHFIDFIRFDTT